ncbi:MTH1187 family thiamine-binding protein [Dethiosulfatarculus sandiegensis]|uniref:Thiamine-binding protein domain-containing protein n=1 Tax=Dethiosulfatarculus sandiegensis TaxID=1429043 RepID=A0A0D2GA89_9BACT|nr:MTH1187 family thiamine-binding protein [Dethiosulfatarculus sandiegensis]KIX11802.1 hypothetical protein X474_22260 [Dethiosulfatarculus sandiegensis]
MAIVNLTIVPLGTQTPSVSDYVAAVHRELEKTGIKNHLTPMGTILEGDLAEILEVVKTLHEVPFEKGAQRVVTTISIDDRRDKKSTAMGKVERVKAKL